MRGAARPGGLKASPRRRDGGRSGGQAYEGSPRIAGGRTHAPILPLPARWNRHDQCLRSLSHFTNRQNLRRPGRNDRRGARRGGEKGDKWHLARPARHNGDLATRSRRSQECCPVQPGRPPDPPPPDPWPPDPPPLSPPPLSPWLLSPWLLSRWLLSR